MMWSSIQTSRSILKLFAFLFLFLACSDPFSYSPFEAKVDSEFRNTTEKNLERISLLDTLDGRPFKVALIADIHFHYDALADALSDIEKRDDFSFVVVVGDITENGLLKEFELFHTIMSRAGLPYLTVIGNHDYLSNGGVVYEQMFGAFNYSFTFNHVKFIAWDNNIWESEKEADYEWLEETFKGDPDNDSPSKTCQHIIPLSHIPPFDRQFENDNGRFYNILKEYCVDVSMHGHKHEFSATKLFDDKIQFVTVGSPQHRTYTELSITPEEVEIRKIEY